MREVMIQLNCFGALYCRSQLQIYTEECTILKKIYLDQCKLVRCKLHYKEASVQFKAHISSDVVIAFTSDWFTLKITTEVYT